MKKKGKKTKATKIQTEINTKVEGVETNGSFGYGDNKAQVNPALDPNYNGNPFGKTKKVLVFGSPNFSLKDLVQ